MNNQDNDSNDPYHHQNIGRKLKPLSIMKITSPVLRRISQERMVLLPELSPKLVRMAAEGKSNDKSRSGSVINGGRTKI